MIVSTASILVLHFAEVIPFTHKSCHPIAMGLEVTFISTEEMRQGNTTRPLQSSTNFRKPATVSRDRNAGIPHLTTIAAKSIREHPHIDHSPTFLAPFG
jgi:hypothetical protein